MRRVWLQLHLWLGIGLAILLVPVSLSGAALVWHDHLDMLIHPGRYAATADASLPPSQLVQRAASALDPGFQIVAVRMPESEGRPAMVTAREPRRGEAGGRPRILTVALDPPTGRVLDVFEFRNSLVGVLHRFHENLTVPEYSGRAIVGWSGVAMLALSLTGLYLWWPRNAGFRRGLRWRRGPTLSLNLHHLFGFWISLPLAVVSATGIYLGFPQQARSMLTSVAPMTPQQRGAFAAPLMRQTQLDADRAAAIAAGAITGSQVAAVFMPTQQTQLWRVQLRDPQSDALSTVMVEDGSGALRVVTPLTGDRVASWIRWIHEGSHSGLLWQMLVFACGLLPTLFTATGVLIWLRSRDARRRQSEFPAVPAAAE